MLYSTLKPVFTKHNGICNKDFDNTSINLRDDITQRLVSSGILI